MNNLKLIVKILSALATLAGIIYLIATYGDKIVAWAKDMMAKCPCCACTENEEAAPEEEAATAEEAPAEEPAAVEEAPAEEAPVEEAAPAEEAPAEDAPVANEEDFEA